MLDELPEQSPLLAGELVFDEGPPAFAKAAVHIFLEDTTLADAPAQVVVHHVLEYVATASRQRERVPFTLAGVLPDTRARYTVRVWVDVDGDGRISHGDYVSTASYPVLTRGYPNRVVVQVRKVR